MSIRSIFSNRLTLLKQTYSLSYSEMAFMFGLKYKTGISEWINSQKSFPNEIMLVIISNIFAVSIDWLLGRTDKPYNECILTKLEEEHAVAIFEMAVATPIAPLPEEYKNTELRRKYYTQGQRANLIYAAMSSFYKTVFSIGTLKQIEKGEVDDFFRDITKDKLTVADIIKVHNTLNNYIANIKDIRLLLYGELDAPVFDLETAMGIEAEEHKEEHAKTRKKTLFQHLMEIISSVLKSK